MASDMKNAEAVALNLARLCGRLSAVVEWCIEHDGECLGDHPKQLAYAREVLSDSRAASNGEMP